MITLEQVEKLRDYANVSYEDAKLALEVANGDMLEAVIYLEKIGKIETPKNGGQYSTDKAEQKDEKETCQEQDYYSYTETDFKKQSKKFFDIIGEWFKKSTTNYFEARRYGKIVISIPVIVLIVSLILFFWITLPLMVVGLFFGCSYHFKGPDLKSDDNPLNQAMNVAKGAADQVKTAFEEEKK